MSPTLRFALELVGAVLLVVAGLVLVFNVNRSRRARGRLPGLPALDAKPIGATAEPAHVLGMDCVCCEEHQAAYEQVRDLVASHRPQMAVVCCYRHQVALAALVAESAAEVALDAPGAP